MIIQAKSGDIVICEEGVILAHPEGKRYYIQNSRTGTGYIFRVLQKIEFYTKTITKILKYNSP